MSWHLLHDMIKIIEKGFLNKMVKKKNSLLNGI